MILKFIQKPIKITAYISTEYSFAQTYSPIERASVFTPKWWKTLSKPISYWGEDNKYNIQTNAKSCLGILGTFQTGYVLPLWSDLSIKIGANNFAYQFSDLKSKLNIHANSQLNGFYEDYIIAKITSPWILKTSEDIKFTFCNPFYMQSSITPYIIPYGIAPTINKLSFTNIFLLFEKRDREITIRQNTPMIHIIPITDKNIEFKTEIISTEEYLKLHLNSERITFNSVGINMLKLLKQKFIRKDRI